MNSTTTSFSFALLLLVVAFLASSNLAAPALEAPKSDKVVTIRQADDDDDSDDDDVDFDSEEGGDRCFECLLECPCECRTACAGHPANATCRCTGLFCTYTNTCGNLNG